MLLSKAGVGQRNWGQTPLLRSACLGVALANHRVSWIVGPQFYPRISQPANGPCEQCGQCGMQNIQCPMHFSPLEARRCIPCVRSDLPDLSLCEAFAARQGARPGASRPIELHPGVCLSHARNSHNMETAHCIHVGFMFGLADRVNFRVRNFQLSLPLPSKERCQNKLSRLTFLGHCHMLIMRS